MKILWAALAAALGLGSLQGAEIIVGPVHLQSAAGIVTTATPLAVSAGDLNGDGKIDLVIGMTNRVSFQLGAGNGIFNPINDYVSSGIYRAFTIADFTGDGIPEAFFPTYFSGYVHFINRTNYQIGSVSTGSDPGILAVGRFLTTSQAPTFVVNTAGGDVATGDLNGDGFIDYVKSGQGISVFFNTNGQRFTAGPVIGSGSTEINEAVVLVDVDGDGDLDLVTTKLNAGSIGVLLNDGAGQFGPWIDYAAKVELPMNVAAADMDGDGILDLVVRGCRGGLSILSGRADGTFGPAIVAVADGQPRPKSFAMARALVVADLNGDGAPDIAWANGAEISMLHNVTPPRLRVKTIGDVVQVSWLTNFASHGVLEVTTNILDAASWREAAFPPLTSADSKLVFDAGREPQRFFRIVKP